MMKTSQIKQVIREREILEASPEYQLSVIKARRMELERKLAELRKLAEPLNLPPHFGVTIKERNQR